MKYFKESEYFKAPSIQNLNNSYKFEEKNKSFSDNSIHCSLFWSIKGDLVLSFGGKLSSRSFEMQIRLITSQLYLKTKRKHFLKDIPNLCLFKGSVIYKKLNHTMKYVAFLSVSTLFHTSGRLIWCVEMRLIKFSFISQVKKMCMLYFWDKKGRILFYFFLFFLSTQISYVAAFGLFPYLKIGFCL